MRNLDVTTLRSFVAVAEQGGVTRAAAALNLTQSAVSMQLKRLEELLGQDLLDRSNRRIALTGSGELLLTYARRLVELNDEAVGRLTDDVYEGELILGAPYDVIYPVVPQVLKRFHALCPRVKVQLRSSTSLKLLDSLKRGEVDLILTTEAELTEGGETLKHLPLRWIGAPRGTAWKQRPLPLANCMNCSFRVAARELLEQEDIAWEQAVESDSDRTVEATVAADLAVTVMLEGTEPPHLEQIAPGCNLPELGEQKINLYGGTAANGGFVGHLKEMIRQGYRAM